MVDPLTNKYPGWSPYVYCFDNPLKYFDPDGKKPFDFYNQMAKNAYSNVANYFGNLYLKHTPAILDYGSTATGLASYAFPPLWKVSALLKASSMMMKVDNPYYQTGDIVGDILGGFMGIKDPITGEIINITIDEALKKNYLTNANLEEIHKYNHHQKNKKQDQNQEEGGDTNNNNDSDQNSNKNNTSLPDFKMWVSEDVWQDKNGNFHLR